LREDRAGCSIVDPGPLRCRLTSGEQPNIFIHCRGYDKAGAGFLKSRVYAKLLRRLIFEMLSDF